MDVSSSQKLAQNDNGQAVIETRGEGSYVATYPTEGYEFIQLSFEDIPIITPEERLELFVSAKMLNKRLEKDLRRNKNIHTDFLDKFPSYDKDIKIGIKLLEEAGWQEHSEDDVWVNYTRPGKETSDGISGGYNKELKFFYCFTTSTQFEEGKPYNNHALYAELKCDGRYDVAYAKLYDAGHGDIQKDDLSKLDWDYKLKHMLFLSNNKDEGDYLEKAAKGEIEQGLVTGWPTLDEYFRWKANTFNFGVGYDGTGKSYLMLSMMLACNLLHGWKFGIVAPENKPALNRRRLMEMRTGVPIKELYKHPKEFERFEGEVYNNFFIATNDTHYSLEGALDMGAKMHTQYGVDAILLDPMNFFSRPAGYDYVNDILSKIRVFTQKYCSVYLMAHPRSETARTNRDAQGYLLPPSPYDVQMGADLSYRADDFFIIHRVKDHPDPEIRTTAQFIMTKVKEFETGGRVHDHDTYTGLRWETRNNFTGYWDDKGRNPMYEYLYGKQSQAMIKPVEPSINIF
jgi:hypothetical protein